MGILGYGEKGPSYLTSRLGDETTKGRRKDRPHLGVPFTISTPEEKTAAVQGGIYLWVIHLGTIDGQHWKSFKWGEPLSLGEEAWKEGSEKGRKAPSKKAYGNGSKQNWRPANSTGTRETTQGAETGGEAGQRLISPGSKRSGQRG